MLLVVAVGAAVGVIRTKRPSTLKHTRARTMSPSHERKERDPSKYTRTPTVLMLVLRTAYSPGRPYQRDDMRTWTREDSKGKERDMCEGERGSVSL